eukprot:scaffold236565_cov47-Prasinocladus_malaysianus.AAC.2
MDVILRGFSWGRCLVSLLIWPHAEFEPPVHYFCKVKQTMQVRDYRYPIFKGRYGSETYRLAMGAMINSTQFFD